MATQQLALGPLTALAGEMENNFNRFLDDVAGGAPPEIRDILFESRQSTMGRALLADAIDVIPVVGDVSNGAAGQNRLYLGRNLGWNPEIRRFWANQCGGFLTRVGFLVKWGELTFCGSGNIVGSIPGRAVPWGVGLIWEIPDYTTYSGIINS